MPLFLFLTEDYIFYFQEQKYDIKYTNSGIILYN